MSTNDPSSAFESLSLRSRALRFSVGMLSLLFLGLLPSAMGQTGLTLQLVPETIAIVPGKPFRVGLFIQHQPGWHTYWQQPGIVGVGTSLEWALPKGFKAGALEYPEPESIYMFRIKAQGFERDVLLQTVITPPDDLQAGQTILLKGRASWMCCGDTCHPGLKEVALSLPVSDKAEPDAKWASVFAKERAAYPRSTSSWTAQASEKGLEVTLKLIPGKGARPFKADEKVIFFTEDGWINSDEPQAHEFSPDGGLTVRLTRADVFLGKSIPVNLQGVIQREGGWVDGENWRSLSLSPPLQRP